MASVKDLLKDVVGEPLVEHKIVYDSASETLEPVYFFILDLMNDLGLGPQKLIDNFSSSPGSGHFGELGIKKSQMQQQGQNALAQINTILRSVLNLVYDLKDFRTRLQMYDDFNSKDGTTKDAARQSLKQLWLDKVDMQKGQGSIHAMTSGQLAFVTLRDSFLAAKDPEDVEKLDLNERVKRVLKPRIREFNIWIEQSEKELRKRYEIERNYLKSQVNSLKLYSRWAKPYLLAAQQLEMSQDKNPALVTAFNTTLLELTLMGKKQVQVKEAALEGDLPKDFEKLKTKRDYYGVVLVDFIFRGIPQVARQAQQGSHYVFGGRADVTFSAYALNDDELKKFDQEFEKSDIHDVLSLIEGATDESLKQLQEEIEFFLQDKEKEEEKKKEGDNPFLALVGYYNKEKKPEKKEEKKEIDKVKEDTWIEKEHLRKMAGESAKDTSFNLFNIYKKAHDMANFNP